MALIRCPKRIVRDGRLVAFAGEYMSEAEAKRRGIFDEINPAEETKQEEAAEEVAEEPAEETKQEEAAEEVAEEPAEETKQEADFDDMTVAELHTFIEEHGSDASAKAKKAELVEIAKGL